MASWPVRNPLDIAMQSSGSGRKQRQSGQYSDRPRGGQATHPGAGTGTVSWSSFYSGQSGLLPPDRGPSRLDTTPMIRFEDLVDKVRANTPEADIELLRRAYVFSALEHKG